MCAVKLCQKYASVAHVFVNAFKNSLVHEEQIARLLTCNKNDHSIASIIFSNIPSLSESKSFWKNVASKIERIKPKSYAHVENNNFNVFAFMSKELLSDRQLLDELINAHNLSMLFISQLLSDNVEFHTNHFQQDPNICNMFCRSMRCNEEMIKTVLATKDPVFFLSLSTFFASNTRPYMERFNLDREFMLQCIKLNPDTIQYTSIQMRNDPSIMIDIVKNNAPLFVWASKSLLDDKAFVTSCLPHIKLGNYLQNLGETILTDRRLMLHAIKSNFTKYEKMKPMLKQDRIFVMNALRICAPNAIALKFIWLQSATFHHDPEFQKYRPI